MTHYSAEPIPQDPDYENLLLGKPIQEENTLIEKLKDGSEIRTTSLENFGLNESYLNYLKINS
ncbi:MAG: hypothetical protein KJ949_01100 [Nanoarchaeota archaeon]|nr:hypothetical protein [Nanoarchaeota archaeon]